ncbi:MAG: VacJ family lipoprotein [Burkholderiaceae bacterium]|nr:VacJ family lipoprotein [Sulfuritalea sp.]MCF8175660.1 VacJ family lipoprotein [Burkholderiaceae bacterium]MCF8183878.1 VacJ family lipoprotein [Polynucleobacter sp.]
MNTTLASRIKSAAVATMALGLLAGCATSGNPKDPIEGFNRAVFAFNEGLDTVIMKPVATGYEAVLPSPIRTGVTNFFSNIEDLFIGVNNLLQGKVPEAFSDLGRVVINSTVGLLGVIDFATDAGLEKHDEDFGQTFGRWGVGNGAYVVVPVFGPRTVRDTVGLVLDVAADPVANHNPTRTRDAALVLRLVNDRANLLPADKVIEEAALDKYTYMRDAYLQRRRKLIHDGNAPREVEASADQIDPPMVAIAGIVEPRIEAPTLAPVMLADSDHAKPN